MKFYCEKNKNKTPEHHFMSMSPVSVALSPMTFWDQFKAYTTK